MLRVGDLCQVDASEVQKGVLKGRHQLGGLQLSRSTCHGQTKEISKVEEILECLQPHENLRDLRIMGYSGVKSPSWLVKTSLSNVRNLCLTDCMKWKILPPLHVLPNLEVLEIRNMPSLTKVSTIPQ